MVELFPRDISYIPQTAWWHTFAHHSCWLPCRQVFFQDNLKLGTPGNQCYNPYGQWLFMSTFVTFGSWVMGNARLAVAHSNMMIVCKTFSFSKLDGWTQWLFEAITRKAALWNHGTTDISMSVPAGTIAPTCCFFEYSESSKTFATRHLVHLRTTWWRGFDCPLQWLS